MGIRKALINCARGWARQHALHIRSGISSTLPDRLRAAALNTELGLPEAVERLLVIIAGTTEQIAAADRDLLQLAQCDPICQRLMRVPGVGPATALRFTAAADDIGLFPTAHSVEALRGLTRGENSSTERKPCCP